MFNRFGALVLAQLLALACTPEIGDECTSATECVTTETDRLCLTEAIEGFQGGYCTVFNCEPDSCPEEAVCVGYRTTLANSEECSDPLESGRLQRNYCMRECSSDSDCRGGYACLDLSEPNPWGAKVLELGSNAKAKICAPPYTESSEPTRASDVCSWSTPQESESALDAGMSVLPPTEAGAAVLVPDAAAADAAVLVPDAAATADAPDAALVPDAAELTRDAGQDAAARERDAATAAAFDASSGRVDAAVDAAVADAAPR